MPAFRVKFEGKTVPEIGQHHDFLAVSSISARKCTTEVVEKSRFRKKNRRKFLRPLPQKFELGSYLVLQGADTRTSGSTDIPGRNRPSLLKSGLSFPSKSTRTGMRCTTFT